MELLFVCLELWALFFVVVLGVFAFTILAIVLTFPLWFPVWLLFKILFA